MPRKKPDSLLKDIYQSHAPAEKEAPQTPQDVIARDILRHQIYSFLFGSLTLVLAVAVTAILIRAALPKESFEAPAVTRSSYVPSYTLPADEQWALTYARSVKIKKPEIEAGEEGLFSATRIERAAYECIMGEQAFRYKDWASAQTHFENALEAFPDLRGVRPALGAAYLNQQKFEAAAKQLRLALKENPSTDVLNNLGAAYIGTEQYDEAENLLKEALQQNPDLPGCYKNLGMLYQSAGRTNDAIRALGAFLTMSPGETDVLRTFTEYQIQAGEPERAVAFLEQLQGADPKAVTILLAKAAAGNHDADRAVRALRDASRVLSPRQMIITMHDDTFEGIAQTDLFKILLHEMELASVSYASGPDPDSTRK